MKGKRGLYIEITRSVLKALGDRELVSSAGALPVLDMVVLSVMIFSGTTTSINNDLHIFALIDKYERHKRIIY